MPAPLVEVHVVLVRPRWARNLGSVARAMKNFELRRLTLVDSRIGSWSDAWLMAVHARDVLEGAVSCPDVATAVQGARWIVTTSHRAPPGAEVLTPREVAERARVLGPPTLVFGGELHGLEPKELLRSHAVSTIPTGSSQSSLNLAQAVAVYAAELFGSLGGASAAPSVAAASSPVPAPPELLQHLERLLTELLENSRWAAKSRGKHAIAQLMQPLYRARMTEAEVRGWLVALGKAAQPRPGPDRPRSADGSS